MAKTAKASSETVIPLNAAGEARDALYAKFVNDCTNAGLKPIDLENFTVAGRSYTGPAVNVRDLKLVRDAFDGLTLTAASGGDTFYVLPILEPVDLV